MRPMSLFFCLCEYPDAHYKFVKCIDSLDFYHHEDTFFIKIAIDETVVVIQCLNRC